MSDSPFLPPLGALPQRARFPAHGARALRAEIEATSDPSLLAFLHHELGRIYLAAGDYGAAARAALEAHEQRPDLAEPLEALITIAHLKGSGSQLPTLLGELAREPDDSDQALRATFEFLAALLVRSTNPNDEANELRSIVEPMLESGPESGAVWLLAEITAALTSDRKARARAILGRVGTAQSPEVRGALLERAASVYQEAGNFEAARESLLQAKDEFPHRALFRRLEELAAAEGNYETAAEAAREESLLCEERERAVPMLRQALWLERGGSLTESRQVLESLAQDRPGDVAGPLLLAALARREGQLPSFFESLSQALALAPPHDQDVFRLALLRAQQPGAHGEHWAKIEPKLGSSQVALGLRLWSALTQDHSDEELLRAVTIALGQTEPKAPTLEKVITFLDNRARHERGEAGLGPRLDQETLLGVLPNESLTKLLIHSYFSETEPKGLLGASASDLPSELAEVVRLAQRDLLLKNPETRAEGLLELRALLAQEPSDLTSLVALARALDDKPEEAAFLLHRGAEGLGDAKLKSVFLLWAGLELARAGKNERARRMLALAEDAWPGALGDFAIYLGEPTRDRPGTEATSVAELYEWASEFESSPDDPRELEGSSPESRTLLLLEEASRTDASRLGEELGLSAFDGSIVTWGNGFDSGTAQRPSSARGEGAESSPLDVFLETVWTTRNGQGRTRSEGRALRELLGPNPADRWFLAEEALQSGQIAEGLSVIDGAASPHEQGHVPIVSPEEGLLRLLKAYQILASSTADGDGPSEALGLLASIKDQLEHDETYWLASLVAAEATGRPDLELEALEKLAELREDTPEAAELWEKSGILRTNLHGDAALADHAFEQALIRDPDRDVSFRRGLERARAQGDHHAALRLIELRAQGALSPERRARLLWEKARVARKAERHAAELEALRALSTIDAYRLPVCGRLAQIHLRDGRLREATECLMRIAVEPSLPREVIDPLLGHTVNLLDELSEPKRALRLLEGVGVSQRPPWFKEELARFAAKSGEFALAFAVFAELNDECDDISERLRHARLMLAIARDHLQDPKRSSDAARRVLRDAPLDRDAVDLALELGFSTNEKRALVAPSLRQAKKELIARPLDGELAQRYVELAENGGDDRELFLARGVGRLLLEKALPLEAASALPNGSLSPDELRQLSSPELGETELKLLALIGRAIAPLTQPDLASLDLSYLLVHRADEDSPAGAQIRPWARAFGVAELEVIVGGKDPSAWFLIPAEPPLFVIGSAIPWPLSERRVARLAAELASANDFGLSFLAMERGEAESWLDAFVNAEGTEGHEAQEKKALLRQHTSGPEWAHIELLAESLRGRGATTKSILLGIIRRALKASIVALGHAGALVHVQDFLPEDEGERRDLLSDAIRFGLGDELIQLRRKLGLE